ESVRIAEVHLHLPDMHLRAGDFRAEAQGDTLVRLDTHRQDVRLDLIFRRQVKKQMRHALELDDDLGGLARHPLAGAQVERHIGPAPAIHEQLERDVGLRVRVRLDIRLLAIAGYADIVDDARPILPAHGGLGQVLRVDRHDGLQHVGLAVAYAGAAVTDRRVHRDDGEQLQQVVLEHVPQTARLLIVPAPMLHAERLRRRDLDMIHIAAVPDRLDDRVGEAEREDILHGLLAKIVVYAVYLFFLEDLVDRLVQLDRRRQVIAERLLDDDARPAVMRLRVGGDELVRAEPLHDVGIEAGRRRQVEETIDGLAVGLFEFAE